MVGTALKVIATLSADAVTSSGGYVDVFQRSETEAIYLIEGWAYNPVAPGNSGETATGDFTEFDPIEIDPHTKIDYENLLEKLDELDDVQEIYDNL